MARLKSACVVVDRAHARGQRSLRWDLIPFRTNVGILHAKLSILLWQHHARVIVASANLTENGYRQNLEVFTVWDFYLGGSLPAELFGASADFASDVLTQCQNQNPGGSPAWDRSRDFLTAARRRVSFWLPADSATPRLRSALVPVTPASLTVFDQLINLWPSGSRPESLFVLSPFFDQAPQNVPATLAWDMLRQRGDAEILYSVVAEPIRASEKLLVHAPASLAKSLPGGKPSAKITFERLEMPENRALHAKSLWLENSEHFLHLIGSSNFTSAGLGIGANRNWELNVATWARLDNREEFSPRNAAWPDRESEPIDPEEVDWEPYANLEDESDPKAPLLPNWCGSAVYFLKSEDQAALELNIPQRDSSTYYDRLTEARNKVTTAIAGLWTECLRSMRLRLPLLILDEAHHLKNARTRLASLFHSGDDDVDSQSLRPKGSLGGVFERMLFLTATPFQLGHHELCSVIERFDGIDWGSSSAPTIPRKQYREELQSLRGKLDRAQFMALTLNETWGRLTTDDLVSDGVQCGDIDSWWSAANSASSLTGLGQQVVDTVKRTKADFRSTEEALRPWVIRHLRPKSLTSGTGLTILRRQLYPGAAILNDDHTVTAGLSVEGRALLPFLLAARATLCRPDKRPVFAEGLASSYESFLHTRAKPTESLDEDDEGAGVADQTLGRAEWYLDQLNTHLPLKNYEDSVTHPKIFATTSRVVNAWKAGEKVVVFCHFIRTGYALRRAISGQIRDTIAVEAGAKLSMVPDKALEELEGIGLRFFDGDSKARKEIGNRVDQLLKKYDALHSHSGVIHEVVRRFLRTPSFLVRFFPLADTQRVTAESISAAFSHPDSSGLSFGELLQQFFEFLAARCSSKERAEILAAVNSMQTGGISDKDAQLTFLPDELGEGRETLMANVRLVNGSTLQATRQRLMLTFNSPFFPEVLIASAVMAEGVDLHRYCRYVIHHDLCWNPSTLEQRTGRIDRIGAKVETARRSIHLYKPFLVATQDERQFQVVSDRERWFNIVMGAEYSDDVASTEKQAKRLRLASAVTEELTFRLEVAGDRALGSPLEPAPVAMPATP